MYRIDKSTPLYDKIQKESGYLRPGEVHPEHFRMLIEASSNYSPKVIQFMEDFLVRGVPRKTAYEMHGVSASYASIALRKLQRLSQIVVMMHPYYIK